MKNISELVEQLQEGQRMVNGAKRELKAFLQGGTVVQRYSLDRLHDMVNSEGYRHKQRVIDYGVQCIVHGLDPIEVKQIIGARYDNL